MKWQEPWRNTLRRQDPWKVATWANCSAATIWTVSLLAIFGLGAYANGTPLPELLSRLWVAPVVGIGLTLIQSGGHWLSPVKVDSGPRGIIVSKWEALGLIPWQTIRSYRIYELDGERVLELRVTDTNAPERLYLAEKVDAQAVEQELRSKVVVEAQPIGQVDA